MSFALFGAARRTGGSVVVQALAQAHEVVALVRGLVHETPAHPRPGALN